MRVRGGGVEGGVEGGGSVAYMPSTFSHSAKQVYCVKHTKEPIVNQR